MATTSRELMIAGRREFDKDILTQVEEARCNGTRIPPGRKLKFSTVGIIKV
jgi:hypothetical protein